MAKLSFKCGHGPLNYCPWEVKDLGFTGLNVIKKKVFRDEEKVDVLRKTEQGGKSIHDVCQAHIISKPTLLPLEKEVWLVVGE